MSVQLHDLDPETVSNWIKEGRCTLVDVREAHEVAQKRLVDADWNPTSQFDPSAVKEVEGKVPVFYCKGGIRSASCGQKWAEQTGQKEVFHMAGGIDEWCLKGLPVEQDRGQRISIERQVSGILGGTTLTGLLIGYFVHPAGWGLVALSALHQLFVAATGICALTIFLGKIQFGG